MILMVGICFTMSSCTKEKSLKGTTWFGVESNNTSMINYTLSFYEYTYTLGESDDEFYFISGTYTYDDPIVILYHNDEQFLSGKVAGDSLVFFGNLIFTKE